MRAYNEPDESEKAESSMPSEIQGYSTDLEQAG
jgi:hypothetical protein